LEDTEDGGLSATDSGGGSGVMAATSGRGAAGAAAAGGDELTYITPRELMIQRSNQRHSSKFDECLGTVCLGANVKEEKERSHWMSVIMTPRKVFSVWQTLY